MERAVFFGYMALAWLAVAILREVKGDSLLALLDAFVGGVFACLAGKAAGRVIK